MGSTLSSVISSPDCPIHPRWPWPALVATAWTFLRPPTASESASLFGFQFEESGALASESSGGRGLGPTPFLERVVAGPDRHSLDVHDRIAVRERANRRSRIGTGGVGGPGAAGQSVAWTTRNPEEDDELGDILRAAEAGLPTRQAWARYVSGVDQAIENVRSEADERLRQERQPAKPQVPDTSLRDKDNSGPKIDRSTSMEPTAPATVEGSHAEQDRLVAVDLAIGTCGTRGKSRDGISSARLHSKGGHEITRSRFSVPRTGVPQ